MLRFLEERLEECEEAYALVRRGDSAGALRILGEIAEHLEWLVEELRSRYEDGDGEVVVRKKLVGGFV